jgi:hypothetical protein
LLDAIAPVNVHIVDHLIIGVGAILLFIAAFSHRYRSGPLHIRILLFLTGPVGVAWSIVGLYLIQHTTAQGHTTLPWSQFWTLSHTKSNLGGFGIGILTALLVNPGFYKRKRHVNTSI